MSSWQTTYESVDKKNNITSSTEELKPLNFNNSAWNEYYKRNSEPEYKKTSFLADDSDSSCPEGYIEKYTYEKKEKVDDPHSYQTVWLKGTLFLPILGGLFCVYVEPQLNFISFIIGFSAVFGVLLIPCVIIGSITALHHIKRKREKGLAVDENAENIIFGFAATTVISAKVGDRILESKFPKNKGNKEV